MKNLREASLPAVLAALLALSSTGCSLLFVNERPSPRPGTVGPPTGNCTSSQVAPVLDTIFTGLEATRVVYAASADDSVYSNPNQPLSRGADVALGLGFTALFLGSSIYGYVATGNCRKYQNGSDHTADEDLEFGPADVKGGSQQPAQVAPPTASLDAPSPAEAGEAPSPAAAATAPDATALDATDATAPATTGTEAAPTPPPAPPADGKP